jgi:hypothetical protein
MQTVQRFGALGGFLEAGTPVTVRIGVAGWCC